MPDYIGSDAFFPADFWPVDFWPEYGTPVSLVVYPDYMWSEGFFPVGFWPTDFWPVYGVAVSPDAPDVVPTFYPYTAGYQPEGFSIWLNNPQFRRVKLINEFIRLEYKRALGAIGLMKLELPRTFGVNLFQEDSIIEIWRGTPGHQYLDGETVWFIRDWDFTLSEQGEETITLWGPDANYLLDAPIIAYNEGTAYTTKSGPADNMMKAFVREQLVSPADTTRIMDTVRVEVDRSQGPTTSKEATRARLLTMLQEISQDAAKAGQQIFFDMVVPERGIIEFRTYLERGQNRGTTSGDRLVLSPYFGTLGNVRRSFISSSERNYIYVGGSGEGAARLVETVTDSQRVNISPYNRRELFLNRSNIKTRPQLQKEGQAQLRASRPRETFTARIVNTPQVQYGVHWRLGTIVAAEYRNVISDARVEGVKTTIARGEVTTEAELRVEA